MRSKRSRRSLLAGTAGAIGIVGASGYVAARYSDSILGSDENSVQFRRLRGTNHSADSAELHVTVRDDGAHVYEQTYEFEAAADDEGNDKNINGPWLKESGEFSVHAELADERYTIEYDEIVDRLEEIGEGTDCAAIMLTITDDRTLESSISASDRC